MTAVAIRRLRVENFRSFKQLDLELSDFNVVIGANASGKSNLVQIFRFLRDIGEHGLEDAVSLQGGIEYLRTLTEPSGSPEEKATTHTVCDVTWEFRHLPRAGYGTSLSDVTGYACREARHRLELRVIERGPDYEVVEEILELDLEIAPPRDTAEETRPPRKNGSPGSARIRLLRQGQYIEGHWPNELPFSSDLDAFFRWMAPKLTPSTSSLVLARLLPPANFLPPLFTESGPIAVFDFEPKLPKSAVLAAGRATLEENGENLAIVLKDILKDPSKRRKLNNLLRHILDFVEDLDVQQLPDQSLFLRIAERYAPGMYFPAHLVSDGTVNVIALLVALHFDARQTIVIEEPERNIHPYLIKRLVEEMREVSRHKQILITTHNPELVRHALPQELLLISRDKRGLSHVSRPAEKESVKFFLEQEMGIEEMYVQNLLELPS